MFNRQFNIHKDFQDLNYLENEIFPKIRNAEFETVEDKKQVKGTTVSMKMARQEGWTKNPKYSSMPELMLRNRAATFFGRQYIPDLLLGVQTSEEVIDIEPEPINVSESSVQVESKQEDENDLGF